MSARETGCKTSSPRTTIPKFWPPRFKAPLQALQKGPQQSPRRKIRPRTPHKQFQCPSKTVPLIPPNRPAKCLFQHNLLRGTVYQLQAKPLLTLRRPRLPQPVMLYMRLPTSSPTALPLKDSGTTYDDMVKPQRMTRIHLWEIFRRTFLGDITPNWSKTETPRRHFRLGKGGKARPARSIFRFLRLQNSLQYRTHTSNYTTRCC